MKSVLLGMWKSGWAVAILFVCLVSADLAANEYKMKWLKHQATTCTDAKITGWHTTGTTKLKTDDDGAGTADVACNTTLTKDGATDGTWVYDPFGDELITSAGELGLAFASIGDPKPDHAVVTSIIYPTGKVQGAHFQKKIILSAEHATASTLAHEVGHVAGNADLNPTITLRIMNGVGNDEGTENRVTCAERDKYLGL